MTQKKIDRTGSQSNQEMLSAVDANFDDLFDLVQILDADYTFVATVSAQQLLNASPNGALNVRPGLYEFECMFDMTGLSTASSTFGFALGGSATLDSQKWQATANKATLATAAASQSTVNIAANVALATATTNAVGWAYICGVFRVSSIGTVIPQVSFSTVATGGTIPTVKKNSFFRAKKLSEIYTASLIAPPVAPGPPTSQWS